MATARKIDVHDDYEDDNLKPTMTFDSDGYLIESNDDNLDQYEFMEITRHDDSENEEYVDECIDDDLNMSIEDVENVDESETPEPVVTPRKRGRPKKTVETKDTKPEYFDWSMKLRENDDQTEVKEFNATYVYKPIYDPANQKTHYFSAHFHKNGTLDKNDEKVWVTNNICLSHNYRIAMTEKMVENLKKKIKIETENHSISPFVSSWYGTTTKSINLYEYNEIKMLHEAFYGELNTDNSKNRIEIFVLNSFNGKSSLSLDYVIGMDIENISGKVKSVKDYFTLISEKNRFGHRGSFEVVESNLSNIMEKYTRNCEILKNAVYTNNDEYQNTINLIASKFIGDDKKNFIITCNETLPSMKNLYYILFAASQTLSKCYTARRHMEINTIVEKLVNKEIKKYNESKKTKKV